MKSASITYCAWEGDPAILASYSDGRMAGFVNYGCGWQAAHPADLATKAADIGEKAFNARWPSLPLPDLAR